MGFVINGHFCSENEKVCPLRLVNVSKLNKVWEGGFSFKIIASMNSDYQEVSWNIKNLLFWSGEHPDDPCHRWSYSQHIGTVLPDISYPTPCQSGYIHVQHINFISITIKFPFAYMPDKCRDLARMKSEGQPSLAKLWCALGTPLRTPLLRTPPPPCARPHPLLRTPICGWER